MGKPSESRDSGVAHWATTSEPPQDPYRFLALAVLGQAYRDLRGWGKVLPEGHHWTYAGPQHEDAVDAIAFLTSDDCEGWLDVAGVPVKVAREVLREKLRDLGLEGACLHSG